MFADPGSEVVITKGNQATDEGQADIAQRNPDEGSEGARDQHVVNQELEQPDDGTVEGRHDDGEEKKQPEPASIGTQLRPEPPEDTPELHGGRRYRRHVTIPWGREPLHEPVAQLVDQMHCR